MENATGKYGFAREPMKRKENTGFAWEPMENTWKQMCCVGTYGKRNGNTGVAWEPIEIARKTQASHGKLWKTC